MKFEYDPDKSETNLQKHGIDFEEAQNLWNDSNALELQAKSDSEPRFALIARYDDRYWSAFYTYRSSCIRLISVRRSRENEKRIYNES